MDNAQHNAIVNFIWGIADDVLRDVYVRGKYRDVILPMTVIRRLDVLLEPTKKAVLEMKEKLDNAKLFNQAPKLCQTSKQAFYNTSPFTLRDLKARAKQQQLRTDFEGYLDGFSENVQEILNKFKFRNQIQTLVDADILGALIEKFMDSSINLGPKPVLDGDGNERFPGLDNHAMGTIFEELIRRFNEENNEEAGEHFTPRDVVKLMVDLVFLPVAGEITNGTYLFYDGACGTGGMLTLAEERLLEFEQTRDKKLQIHIFGQEINPETYAIAKADLLIKGEGKQAENLKIGSTISYDFYPDKEFDFMLSNPPYGKSWKTDLDKLGGKNEFRDHRFIIEHGGDPEYKMIPRSSDGQLLFLVNMLSKMKTGTPQGSRIAEVHNGSSLFTGDAGQGESNIRRWIIENDWLEAIVALPENMFYNTGIATYIWVLTNKKPSHKKGKIQLIDASNWFLPLRKNLGKKNCELSEDHIQKICQLLLTFNETEQSKIFPNEAFGYWKIVVERPLRLKVELTASMLETFKEACKEAKEEPLAELVNRLKESIGEGPHMDFNRFMGALKQDAVTHDLKLTSKRLKLLQTLLATVDESAEPVIKKLHKPGKLGVNPLFGRFETNIKGKTWVVEYEPDTSLRDTEQVPLLEQGGIETFFAHEVTPYVPDAWIDGSKTLIGYEISFTRYFFKPEPLRTLEEIKADIFELEKETEGLLEQIVGEIKE
jgi:type I restriction enzyme M protein